MRLLKAEIEREFSMSERLTGRRRLYLMRHGHVDYFAPGLTDFATVPLTPEGQRQASKAGEAMADIAFDGIFTSGLRRTVDTASLVIAQNTNALPEPSTMPAFEELRGGQAVVETREELAALLAFSLDAPTGEGASFLPGGELFTDAYARVTAGLDALVREHAWSTALLVAHEGVNRLILAHACGAGLAGVGHFEQDLACVNVLDFDVARDESGQPAVIRIVLKALNVTAYDPVKSTLVRTSLEHLFDLDFGGSLPR